MDTEKLPLLPTHENSQPEQAAQQPQTPNLDPYPASTNPKLYLYYPQASCSIRIRSRSRSQPRFQTMLIRLSLTMLVLLFTTFLLFGNGNEFSRDENQNENLNAVNADSSKAKAKGQKVPFEAHIMSKCPDAKDCLHDLVLPVMQKVGEKVEFRLSYLGNETEGDDGVACKHGPEECLGNIIELCAAKEYPDPKIYLGFTMCLTTSYASIPSRSLIEDCALEHGLDFQKLQDCTVTEDGGLSVELLKQSFRRSREAGVKKSCTIRLNNEIRCVRDEGVWKECPQGFEVEEVVGDIERSYHSFNLK